MYHLFTIFQLFPEALQLDATYKINKFQAQLFVVQGRSSDSQVIACNFVASKHQHIVGKLLEIFTKVNPAAVNFKVVAVDKDFSISQQCLNFHWLSSHVLFT